MTFKIIVQIKAVQPIFESVYAKMDKYIRSEIAQKDFNGFEAKDVKYFNFFKF
jgi:hypothetical protein